MDAMGWMERDGTTPRNERDAIPSPGRRVPDTGECPTTPARLLHAISSLHLASLAPPPSQSPPFPPPPVQPPPSPRVESSPTAQAARLEAVADGRRMRAGWTEERPWSGGFLGRMNAVSEKELGQTPYKRKNSKKCKHCEKGFHPPYKCFHFRAEKAASKKARPSQT